MRLHHRPFIVITILVIVLAATGAISATLYLGVFSPHPQIALVTFNDVYGTAGTRLDTCNTCHTTGSSTNPYGTDLKTKFSLMTIPEEGNLTEEQTLDASTVAQATSSGAPKSRNKSPRHFLVVLLSITWLV